MPLVCRDTVTELVRVLAYPKFRLTAEEREELLGDYLPFAETVAWNGPVDTPDCPDPHDRVFRELAQVAAADMLISGDSDLLSLRSVAPVRILTLAEFLERL